MRRLALFLLLAGTAVPAMAQRDDQDDNQSRHSSTSSQSADRPERAERAERNQARQEARVEHQQSREDRNNGGFAGMRERLQQARQQQQIQQVQQAQQQQAQQQQAQQGEMQRSQRYGRFQRQQDGSVQRVESVQQYQNGQQSSTGGLMPRQRQYRSVPDTTPQVLQSQPDSRDGRNYGRDGRVGTQHSGTYTRWSRNDWRNDRRYDWRRYRDHHRSAFRIGFYFDPFGYGYRQFGAGSFLNAGYYQSNYWINDPWQYRLPPAYGSYRWVRYHNDALLIDTWTGEVVDVIYSFFW